ncbi:hypothetical protein AMECASPLE_015024 [Ameca splendens]|uniref:Uncharacterized protein n=1 Tax=Ameca splendens TaxID=208324 RepID=A0ABV0YD91_9TELE
MKKLNKMSIKPFPWHVDEVVDEGDDPERCIILQFIQLLHAKSSAYRPMSVKLQFLVIFFYSSKNFKWVVHLELVTSSRMSNFFLFYFLAKLSFCWKNTQIYQP